VNGSHQFRASCVERSGAGGAALIEQHEVFPPLGTALRAQHLFQNFPKASLADIFLHIGLVHNARSLRRGICLPRAIPAAEADYCPIPQDRHGACSKLAPGQCHRCRVGTGVTIVCVA
jgi:hypothetical protein